MKTYGEYLEAHKGEPFAHEQRPTPAERLAKTIDNDKRLAVISDNLHPLNDDVNMPYKYTIVPPSA